MWHKFKIKLEERSKLPEYKSRKIEALVVYDRAQNLAWFLFGKDDCIRNFFFFFTLICAITAFERIFLPWTRLYTNIFLSN